VSGLLADTWPPRPTPETERTTRCLKTAATVRSAPGGQGAQKRADDKTTNTRRKHVPIKDPQAAETFTLDMSRLGEHLVREHGSTLGLDEHHEPGGRGGSLRERIHDAYNAGAIGGPVGYEVSVHPRADGELIVAASSPTAHVMRAPIEAKHIPDAADGSFDACCRTLEWALAQATPLIGQLQTLELLPSSRSSTGLTLLERVARELLSESLAEERADQEPQERLSNVQFERHLAGQAEQLAGSLRDMVAAFSRERETLLPRVGGSRS
jgi:hypothetical protein